MLVLTLLLLTLGGAAGLGPGRRGGPAQAASPLPRRALLAGLAADSGSGPEPPPVATTPVRPPSPSPSPSAAPTIPPDYGPPAYSAPEAPPGPYPAYTYP